MGRLHPRLTRRSAWIADQDAELPVLHVLVVRPGVQRLPGGGQPTTAAQVGDQAQPRLQAGASGERLAAWQRSASRTESKGAGLRNARAVTNAPSMPAKTADDVRLVLQL
jgi:hypothetical protein